MTKQFTYGSNMHDNWLWSILVTVHTCHNLNEYILWMNECKQKCLAFRPPISLKPGNRSVCSQQCNTLTVTVDVALTWLYDCYTPPDVGISRQCYKPPDVAISRHTFYRQARTSLTRRSGLQLATRTCKCPTATLSCPHGGEWILVQRPQRNRQHGGFPKKTRTI